MEMTTKSDRIEMRTDPETGERIAQAAEATQQSVSAFVREAATYAADKILARFEHVLMPAEQFDRLYESLDTPDDAPKIAEVARRPRRFTRR
ncbi:uncharacterized protein (DUF1778 family) [Longispora fulva]|uniref:Uncharacterized protein (DUF1778 family) n=2 Tax=Longispora fulva TaxID=619741 RepID=A0A8J7GHR8_9ACTN|nr:uncharacterized protein (DUF1778 family) [Longispora fulva]